MTAEYLALFAVPIGALLIGLWAVWLTNRAYRQRKR
jgi:hypothetical protein